MSELTALRARFDGLRVLTAAVRLQLAIKANFNPSHAFPRASRAAANGLVAMGSRSR